MSQAEELLDTLAEGDMSLYSADPETEEHIVIGKDRKIIVPDALKKIAVQHDHNVETVTFDCIRYWDGHDLSTMRIYINFKTPKGDLYPYYADDVTVDEDDPSIMHFTWTIESAATEYKGSLTFLVCAKQVNDEGYEDLHWNSELNTDMYVVEGLECEEAHIEANSSIITFLLSRMDTSEAIVTDAVNRIPTEIKTAIRQAQEHGYFDIKSVTNDDVAYTKDVPETSALYAEVYKVGGMTRKCTNVLKCSNKTQTFSGVTVTIDSSGLVTLKGTATAGGGRTQDVWPRITLEAGTYYFNSNHSIKNNTYVTNAANSNDFEYPGSFTISTKTTFIVGCNVNSGVTYNESFYIWMNEGEAKPYEPYFEGLRDAKVTEIKSSGANLIPASKGYTFTTLADGSNKFTTLFSDIFLKVGKVTISFDITQGDTNTRNTALLKAPDQSVLYFNPQPNVCNDAGHYSFTVNVVTEGLYKLEWWQNGITKSQTVSNIMLNEGSTALPYSPYTEHTLEIPETVQNLEGYGLGVPNTEYYNYVDFEKKQFVRKVDRVVLTGNEDIGKNESSSSDYMYFVRALKRDPLNNRTISNLLDPVSAYPSGTQKGMAAYSQYKCIFFNFGKDITDRYGNNVAGVKTYIKKLYDNGTPFEITYSVAEEVVDISNLLVCDGIIDTEEYGSLTFVNEHEYAVPSTVEFHLNNNDMISSSKFVGDLKGTARRAIGDEDGNSIKDTYGFKGRNYSRKSDTRIIDIPTTEGLGSYAEIDMIKGKTRKCTNLLDGSFIANTSAASVWVRKEIVLKPNTTYVVSCNIPSSIKSTVGIFFYNSQGTASGAENQVTDDKDVLITTLDDGIIKIQYIVHDLAYDIGSYKYMLNEGSTALPYEPYFEGLRDAKVTEIKSVGRNLLRASDVYGTYSNTTLTTKDGRECYKFTSSTDHLVSPIDFKGNTQYTVRFKYCAIKTDANATADWMFVFKYTDGTTTYLNNTADGTWRTFTLTSTKNKTIKYIGVTTHEYRIDNYVDINTFMLVEGAEMPDEYIPYTEHTLKIPKIIQNLNGYGLDIPGTDYCNYVDFKNKKFGRLAREKVFDGTENFIRLGTKQYAITLTDCLNAPYSNNVGICSHFDYTTDAYSGAVQGFVINNQTLIFCYRELEEDDVTLFKNKVAEWYENGNPVKLVYPLATPETVDISEYLPVTSVGIEQGGTMTLVNEFDYDVESEVTFHLNSQEEVSATHFVGDLTGMAQRALADSQGNVITTRYVTPQMFGAVTDGVTDCTSAIQQAVDYASAMGMGVMLPGGRYLITSPIILPGNTVIRGMQSTSIYKKTSTTATVGGTAINSILIVNGNNIVIEDMQLYGDGEDISGTDTSSKKINGITFANDAYMFTIARVKIIHCYRGIDDAKQCYMGQFDRVHFVHCLTGVYLNGDHDKTSLTFINCWCQNCGNAYMFKRLTYSNIISCGADWCNHPTGNEYGQTLLGSESSQNGIYNFTQCDSITMSGCGAEDSYGYGVVKLNASRVTVNGLRCSRVGSYANPPSSYPDYAYGIFNIHINSSNLIVNNVYTDTDYDVPEGKTAYVLAYNCDSNAYPNNRKMAILSGIATQGLANVGGFGDYATDVLVIDTFAGISGGGSTSSFEDMKVTNILEVGVLKTVAFNSRLTHETGGNALMLHFKPYSSNKVHLIRVRGCSNKSSDLVGKGFDITFTVTSGTTVYNPVIVSKCETNIELIANGDEYLYIKFPHSYTGMSLSIEGIIQENLLDAAATALVAS